MTHDTILFYFILGFISKNMEHASPLAKNSVIHIIQILVTKLQQTPFFFH